MAGDLFLNDSNVVRITATQYTEVNLRGEAERIVTGVSHRTMYKRHEQQ